MLGDSRRNIRINRGFGGGGGLRTFPFFQWFDRLPTHWFPLCTIFRYPFLNDPKNFLKATLAPIYTNFEGELAPKNAIFWSTFSGVFFQKLSCVAENLSKWGLYSDFGELRESIWSTWKKVDTIWEFLFKNLPCSPREYSRSATDSYVHIWKKLRDRNWIDCQPKF